MFRWWDHLRRNSAPAKGGRASGAKMGDVEPDVLSVERPTCTCLSAQFQQKGPRRWPALKIHNEPQDTSSSAWRQLLELIDEAARLGHETFDPGARLRPRDWATIVTLPTTISQLTMVKRLILYGSSLTRIPPEIGDMASLEEFDPYTSYRLHWLPYEITRCTQLASSRISTRALYGNYKHRPPFPRLPQLSPEVVPRQCSVCRGVFGSDGPLQRWISLRVATDVVPLLVHGCSEACVARLPTSPEGYVPTAHEGGLRVKQPPVDPMYSD